MLPIVLFRSRFMLLRVFIVALVSLFAFSIYTSTAQAQTPDEPAGDDILFLMRPTDVWTAYIMSADGSHQRPVTKGLNFPRSYINVYDAVFSPDRTYIVLALIKTDRPTPKNQHRLYRANADGTGLKLLWHGNADYLRPAWSPSGDQIAFTATGDNSTSHVYVVNSDGSGLKRLSLDDGGYSYGAAWSPNGEQILFYAEGVLSVINADGTGLQSLPSGADAVWSPDGQRIAIARSEPDAGLYLVNPDGSGLEQVAQMSRVAEPRWSPDGAFIAFLAGPYGQQNLYRINADGGELTQLTDTEGKDFICLKWLPNGEQLNVIMYETPLTHGPKENIHLVSADGSGVMTALTDDSTTEVLAGCFLALFG